MIRVTFKHELKDIFSEDEQTIIKSAIFNHSDKKHIHDSYDELLKDSDVLQHWLIDMSNNNKINIRLQGIKKELGLPQSKIVVSEKEKIHSYFSRTRMGDIAENLAAKHIKGIETDADYMKIIRYYPEGSAFDELKNGWCAAFVYHCVEMAGLELPIKYKPLANRFACVEAWLRWGEENNFCFWDKSGFTPSKGDIVIYSKTNK